MGKENKRQKEQTTKHKFTKLADQSENFGKKVKLRCTIGAPEEAH